MNKGSLNNMAPEYFNHIKIHYGDLTDASFFSKLLKEEHPEELYHLAAQSFVGYSFENPAATYDVNISGTLNVVNAIKEYSPDTRMYFAATSELFGSPEEVPQNEKTPFRPRSPYAISKLAGYWMCKAYRDAYGLYISNGILFNYESEYRGPEFVTKKISLGVARIAHGDKTSIELGNLNARKDWGYSADYVKGMWKMLNYKYADDFVLGTGETHTVREFAEAAFQVAGINIHWKGSGLNEVGLSDKDDVLIKIRKDLYRPLEADNYQADYSKAKRELGWEPKVKFQDLVKVMVNYDLEKSNKS